MASLRPATSVRISAQSAFTEELDDGNTASRSSLISARNNLHWLELASAKELEAKCCVPPGDRAGACNPAAWLWYALLSLAVASSDALTALSSCCRSAIRAISSLCDLALVSSTALSSSNSRLSRAICERSALSCLACAASAMAKLCHALSTSFLRAAAFVFA
eukprot:CAMPEP_0115722810 /NCGR_PEP_ID=MMETSP0272-20121206/79885_1 /TAXON_ID=71861 /ORGANISM="Scrippsiella trochoidea, Strain CCMP3099" /LENGTH=162 /DNA_ID=CAMNT_0003165875 /DNA_START=399 /DNA_END=887 /DNA_ORIENTATION=+